MCETVHEQSAAIVADAHSEFSSKTLQDFEVISVIGNGTFGTCFKVRDKESGKMYAWKGIDYDELSETQKESFVSEINVLRQLKHPNIVQYYHHLVNHEAKSVFIVMECCEGGDLGQLITRARVERKRFEEKYIWRVLFQVCKALQVCHNKIRQGTILHRDIKPANIFLDATGNAKLGDFGLARVLRRNESFAQTFVGTPYYMSPEIVRGSRYDCKSDVWAVGCLTYEMCALQTPFRGHEFEQLSVNISIGKFSSIPDVYSSDLQAIIAFMLAVENEQRPSIEIINRHPIVVRNIVDLGNEFPQLKPAEGDFYAPTVDDGRRCKLDFSPTITTNFSSTMYMERRSFKETPELRRLSVSGVFTPDLRTELFHSAKRRIFQKSEMQKSDPELYESVRRVAKPLHKSPIKNKKLEKSPNLVTKNIIDEILMERLHAIRALECLLKQREASLNAREQQLNKKEKRLQELDSKLQMQVAAIKEQSNKQTSSVQQICNTIPPKEAEVAADKVVPPIPPRKCTGHDDTYCSIEPNDSILQQPTMAKLDLAALPAKKVFPVPRRVTFQSPKKVNTYDAQNLPSLRNSERAYSSKRSKGCNNNQMRTSVSSKGSDESAESTLHRRKSILSIFGLSRCNKDAQKSNSAPAVLLKPSIKERQPLTSKESLHPTCEATDLNSIWTKEHKRAAFDLLAAMNASERFNDNGRSTSTNTNATRQKYRLSVRERNAMQRTRLRRSLVLAPPPPINTACRGQVLA